MLLSICRDFIHHKVCHYCTSRNLSDNADTEVTATQCRSNTSLNRELIPDGLGRGTTVHTGGHVAHEVGAVDGTVVAAAGGPALAPEDLEARAVDLETQRLSRRRRPLLRFDGPHHHTALAVGVGLLEGDQHDLVAGGIGEVSGEFELHQL